MKVRKISVTTQFMVSIIALFLVSDVILALLSYNSSKKMLDDQVKEDTVKVAAAVAANLDGDIHAGVRVGEEDTDAYMQESLKLTQMLEDSELEYLYTVRYSEGGGLEYAIDAQIEDASMIGDEFEDDEVIPALNGQKVAGSKPYTDAWGTHLSAYAPVYDKSGKVVAAVGADVSMEWVDQQTANLLKTIIIVCVIVVLVGTLILLTLSMALRRKFKLLNDKIVDLTAGDGDLTKKIELNSGDEFEVIGGNINKLIEFIRIMLLSINTDSNRLNSASSNIAGSVRSAKTDAMSIAETMSQMSATMEETAASINEIDSLITDINTSFGEIASEIEGGRDFSREVKGSATKIGQDAAGKRETTKEKVREMAESVEDQIERSKAVEKIGNLTGNIISIASQTNLLALNASIEAARAGDAGRGFAVVATEIGGLATHSQETANEIKEVSQEVITAVEELSDLATQLIGFVNETTIGGLDDLVHISEEYLKSAERISEMMEKFSEASSRINSNIEQIRESADSVNQAVDDAAAGVTKTAERSVEMSDNMSRIDEDAAESSTISDGLKAEVGRFRLE